VGEGGSSAINLGTPIPVANVTCSTDPTLDSSLNGTTPAPNASWNNDSPSSTGVISRKDLTGVPVAVGYMFHPAVGTAQALLVLFSGGDGTTGITADPNTGTPTSNGNNFLVRSADLFAAQGYDVVTIDEPTDEPPYPVSSGYDPYRTSMRHAVDISPVINDVNKNHPNTTTLPVQLAGTSRGAISVVSNYMLTSGVALFSPVTSGGGMPVGAANSPANVQPAYVKVPVQVSWNTHDNCGVSVPANWRSLAAAFHNAAVGTAAVAIRGGFGDFSAACNAVTYHGYFGIESCSVQQETDWMAGVVTALGTSNMRPQAMAVTATTAMNTSTQIDLSMSASDGDGDILRYALPYMGTSLGGTLALSGSRVTYTPPTGVSGTDGTFGYVVNDGKGGAANNLVRVTLMP